MFNKDNKDKKDKPASAGGRNFGDGRRSAFGRGREEKRDEFESRLIDLARVSRMVAGGRRMRFRAVIVVGDKKGRVGLAVAKGHDVSLAVTKATAKAKKNIIKVPLVKGTIPHMVEAKYGSSKVLLKPGRLGGGVAAGGTVRVICSLAGIENIVGKIIGKTTNKLNNARAAIKALKQLKK